MDLKAHIRQIPDFPKPGILFYDISTLLAHAEAWRETVDRVADAVRAYRPDVLAAIESRGFIFAGPVAYKLGIGFTMVRKVGKLPGEVVSHAYDLEYGSDTLQVAEGLIPPGSRVVLIDDLLATGGTAQAAVELVRKLGAEVAGAVFLIELMGLKGARPARRADDHAPGVRRRVSGSVVRLRAARAGRSAVARRARARARERAVPVRMDGRPPRGEPGRSGSALPRDRGPERQAPRVRHPGRSVRARARGRAGADRG